MLVEYHRITRLVMNTASFLDDIVYFVIGFGFKLLDFHLLLDIVEIFAEICVLQLQDELLLPVAL